MSDMPDPADDDAADAPSSHRARTVAVIACVLGLVVGLGIGGAVGLFGRDSDLAVACTEIGASDGVSVRLDEAALAGAASARVTATSGSHVSSVEQVVSADMPDVWLDVPAAEMTALDAVAIEVIGDPGLEASTDDVADPAVVSPNGDQCEPHARQLAYVLEDGELVRQE
ncbi:hypothetical protein ACXET9_05900 [Brachybacterium sp. DNPG3]